MSAPLLELRQGLWEELLTHLRRQGGGVRESGAFLLGKKTEALRTVTAFLPYEQLQVDALHNDYVSLNAASFAKLWELCGRKGLSVVADVHTHRFGAGQSRSDRENPMIALRGHVALIVPNFAQGGGGPQGVGMYVYQGSPRWSSHSGSDIAQRIRLTREGGDS
ncbi:hypothetical protein [Xanthomonas arboricola]|uniref:hypothetical protein n=1 Tax=Xanthomonas arboricola TaxID=56448 RepID=UPI000E1F1B1D|nr:hypothetical protein [Xanthomonas arboricola]